MNRNNTTKETLRRTTWKQAGLAVSLVLSAFCLPSVAAPAQDEFPSAAREFRITFPVNSSKLDRSYRMNAQAFARLDSLLSVHGDVYVDSVLVVSKSSPEGRFKGNVALSERRSLAIYDYIAETHPELVSRVRYTAEHESWGEFRQMLLEDPTISSYTRERALAILDTDLESDAKKSRLYRMPEYKYFLDNYFPAIRFSAIVVVFDRLAMSQAEIGEVSVGEVSWTVPEDELRVEVEDRPVVVPPLRGFEWIRVPLFAASTNLVYDLGGLVVPQLMAWTPNFAIEVPIGQRWSVYGEYSFPWWLVPANDRAWQVLKWDLGARWWFSRHDASDRMDVLRGHFLGLDFGAGYYDIEPKHTGYQGEFQTLGLEYGYAFRLSPAWRLDLYAGAGWLGTHYRYYEGNSDDVHLLYQHHGRLQWFGPVKAGVSIKYIFNRKIKRVR